MKKDSLEAKDRNNRGQGPRTQFFKKLGWTNFPLSLSAKNIAFYYVFDDTLKTVVSKNINWYLEVLRIKSNIDYAS